MLLAKVFITILLIAWADYSINQTTRNLVFNNIELIPHNKVGLLLGTSKLLSSGKDNQYFFNRIAAAVELFKANKIDFIVISGDNSTKDYNEPMDMKNELLKYGIPENKIFLDYAGFRTYDSVVRLNKIFGVSDFTIISQEFHNRRAIYIAKRRGYNAIGYNAKDVNKFYGFKTKVREKFSRLKVFKDIIFNKEPKYMGTKVEIK